MNDKNKITLCILVTFIIVDQEDTKLHAFKKIKIEPIKLMLNMLNEILQVNQVTNNFDMEIMLMILQ